MNEALFYDTLQHGLWVAVVMSIPILSAALIAGVSVGLLQALTSVQEMTLTFVPKLCAIVVVFWMTMNFMTQTLVTYFHTSIVPQIVGG
ncbi:flagellar biosynthetic protein FliQ [Planktotalea sp.]|jgi:flagellar biosynthetic protein FliQ|uniref:flagellar biosynthetic protein FliQ n=1 Tax=Planktotalea sp. TaxID=2029877 RepID=UPI003F6A9074